MNNALLYLGGILITALAVLFAVPRFIDWNSYRGVFEEEASRVLGREVRVGGAVNVRLLPAPFVSFEKLRIADLGTDGGNSIIRVESFTMWLSVPPLLRGVLEAHRVELGRPVVSLSTNEQGSGNWRTLAFSPDAVRFVPKDVALQSVQVHDGAVIISGPQRNELARLDDVNGELTAEALEGPFKFRGSANWGGTLRHIKLATSKMDADGVLRFKTAIDVPATSNSYVFDGRLSDIKEKPTLDGDLTAKFALGHGPKPAPVTAADPVVEPEPAAGAQTGPASPNAAAPPAAVSEAQKAAAPAANGSRGFDLKAKLTGSTTAVALKDIAVSLDAGATPQLITGEAVFDWAQRMRVDLSLASRWLDLDQISPPGEAKVPLEAGRGYFEALAAALPQEADTNARLEFDQLTLGGEPISNVRLAASRAGGPLELKGVRADLPGGVRLELDGILTPSGKVPRLDGSLFVSGKSLLRFLAWGFANPTLAADRNDGAFSLDGQFALGDGTLALSNAAFEFADTPLAGDLKIDLGDQKKLVMTVEGPRIDVAQIGPGLIGLNVMRGLLLGADAPAVDPAGAAPDTAVTKLLDPKTADLSLDLKVAELVDGSRILKDVDTSIRLERGTLSIPRLKFSTPQGLTVEADGEARDVPAHPKGAIHGLVSAPNPEAARAFLTLLDVDPDWTADLDRVAALAPFRVAGTLQLAGAPTDGSTLSLDGTVGGGRVNATVRLDGDRSKWRSAPLDAQMSLESQDIARVIATLFGAKPVATEPAPPTPAAAAGQPPAVQVGRAILKATGVPADGLLTLVDATGNGLSLGYRGKLRLPAPGQSTADGHLQVSAADARTVLALSGLANSDRMAAGALNGAVHIQRNPGKLVLTSDTLTIGSGILSGEVSLSSKDGGPQTIDAKITTNKTTMASLLWPVLGKSTDADILNSITPAPAPAPRANARQQQAEAQAAPPTIVWPEQTFDLAPLDKLSGTVDLKIGALEIEPGLTVRNARLLATLAPGALNVTKLTGEAVGGRMLSHLDIAKAAAGVEVSGALRIDIDSKPLEPSPTGADDALPPGDAAAFGVTFSGRALSPAAVLSTLTGKGEITIGDATLTGNSPAAVSMVARSALTGQGPNSGAALSDAIREALKSGEVKLGKITIPVLIGDGALKLERVRIEMKDGRSTFATAVELATMKIDSEWQIEPKLDGALAASPERAVLPPVTVVYSGKLSQFADLVPTVSAGSLERELVVRKMEMDVGELERLRKLDEQRAREDAARRKAQEEEQARIEAERRKALEADQERTAPPPAPQNGLAPDGAPPGDAPAPGADPIGADITDDTLARPPQDARPAGDLEAAAPPPQAAPSPATQRPRRKRPVDDAWQPFQQLN